MNQPSPLADVMGRGLNYSISIERLKEKKKETAAKKRRKTTRAIRELRDPFGLDPRDLLGL